MAEASDEDEYNAEGYATDQFNSNRLNIFLLYVFNENL